MAVEKSPAFQFYPSDFLMDVNVAAMTLTERGAYITLLCVCWQEGCLSAEPERLARLLKVPVRAFQRLWPALEPCFTVVDGRLVQGRIERERKKQETWRAMKAEAGQKGGKAKAARKQTASKRLAEASPPSSSSSSSPISDLQKEQEKSVRAFPVNGTTDPEIGRRAAKFLKRYPELYQEHRHGARFLPKPALDWPAACELVAVWPDERLEKLAIIFLKTDHEFAANGSRTIRQFAALASWCDDRLRQVEKERGR